MLLWIISFSTNLHFKVSIHQAQIKLTEFSDQPEPFSERYEELKGKNVRDVDAVLVLLSEISKNKEVCI